MDTGHEDETGLRIVVLDDDEEPREVFKKAILEAFSEGGKARPTVELWIPTEEDLEELERRERDLRKHGYWVPSRELKIDQADVLVLDWDLLFLEEGSKDAEPWAYLARCFSNVGVISMLDRWSGLPNPFDLGLRGDPFQREDQRSFADIDLGRDQLGMPLLWFGQGVDSQGKEKVFHPWYWPVLTASIEDWDRRVEDVVRSLLEKPCITVREFLEFDEESWRWLPNRASAFLDSTAGEHPCDEKVDVQEGAYLIDLPSSGRGWSYKHQRTVYDRLSRLLRGSLSEEDWAKTVHSVARPIAGLLAKWLEWLVLPEQDVLVDAPHLAERFPSLLGESPSETEWQALAWRRGEGERPEELTRFEEKLKVHRFLSEEREFWLSRPLWKWRSVKDDSNIPEVADPWGEHGDTDIGRFFEDSSRFGRSESGHAFEADVESPFAERFVEKYEGVDYIPTYRLL